MNILDAVLYAYNSYNVDYSSNLMTRFYHYSEFTVKML